MSRITYRANLSAKSFPFLSQNWGRTIIVPQYDNTFNRQVTSSADVDADVGIPQIYYCHNVMPEQQGFQSIGYTVVQLPAVVGTVQEQFLARDGVGNAVYLIVNSAGNVYRQLLGAWTYVQTLPAGIRTTAYISGVFYLYVAKQGCYIYDFASNTLVAVVLTTLIPANILGITTAAGYMIAWESSKVLWSSTITPADFTPDLVTGAGSGGVEGAKGAINLCAAQLLGFIVYTTNNAVAALFSGNARYPFNFREIVASGGLASLNQLAFDANSGSHYAYTTSGMQLISSSSTQSILPELTDFISGKLFEDYNEVTDVFTSTPLTQTLQKQVNMISDRYLIISYGITSLTHALVYDLVTKRWGKLKIPHVQCFEYQLPSASVIEIPRQSIAFLQVDGTMTTVDFSVTSATSAGVVALGKFQFVRPRMIQLDEIALENVEQGNTFSIYDLVTLDGKNGTKKTPTLLQSSGLFRKYGLESAVGINHSLVLKGAFSLVSLVLTFHIHGKS